MTIEYTISTFVQEEKTFEVENEKYCFLEGRSESNTAVYFGVWINTEGKTKIVTLKNGCIDYHVFSGGYTTCYIKEFLIKYRQVKAISDNTFFNEHERALIKLKR